MRRAWPVGLCTYMWCVVFVAVCMHVHAYGVYATCVCLYVLTSADVCVHRRGACSCRCGFLVFPSSFVSSLSTSYCFFSFCIRSSSSSSFIMGRPTLSSLPTFCLLLPHSLFFFFFFLPYLLPVFAHVAQWLFVTRTKVIRSR